MLCTKCYIIMLLIRLFRHFTSAAAAPLAPRIQYTIRVCFFLSDQRIRLYYRLKAVCFSCKFTWYSYLHNVHIQTIIELQPNRPGSTKIDKKRSRKRIIKKTTHKKEKRAGATTTTKQQTKHIKRFDYFSSFYASLSPLSTHSPIKHVQI